MVQSTSSPDYEQTAEVQLWLNKTGYNTLPQQERTQYVRDVAEFCEYTGKTPYELVRSCLLRTKDGSTKISVKGRRAMQQLINEFVAERGMSGHSGIALGNRIRSFLVHNGVFIQGRASIQ